VPVFDEMRRTADVVDVGKGAGHRLSLVQEIDWFECRESLANAEGLPCKAARAALARLDGIQQKPLTGRAKCVMRPDQGLESQGWEKTKPE
jgi:hypothetical protein